jgi:hypothetical protein
MTKWKEADSNIECKSDDNICSSVKSCDSLASQLSPVGFLIAGGDQAGGETIFEMSPQTYLF